MVWLQGMRRSIGWQILAAVGVMGALVLLAMGAFAIGHMEQSLLAQNERETRKFLDGTSRGLQTIMLAGYADIAQEYVQSLQTTPGMISLQLLRRNGEEAFLDNKTIDEVNTRIGEEEFETRDEEKRVTVLTADDPLLKESVEGVATATVSQVGAEGDRQITWLVPIKNRKECYRCHGSNHKVRGLLKVTTSLLPVEEEIRAARGGMLAGMLLGVAGFLVLLRLLLGRLVERPLRAIHEVVVEMAAGNLLVRSPVTGRGDEADTISASVNRMAESLVWNVRTINMHSGSITAFVKEILNLRRALGGDSENLRAIADEVAAKNADLAGKIDESMKNVDLASENMRRISEGAQLSAGEIETMARQAGQTNGQVLAMAESAREMRHDAGAVTERLAEVNQALGRMGEEMGQMTASLEGVRASCREANHQSRGASDKARETLAFTRDLARASEEVGKVSRVIREIADKTKLLALNASIEAAGAGEYGRGFMVVAVEVKELAQKTAEATVGIADQIRGIQEHTRLAAKAVEEIAERVGGISRVNEAIDGAMDGQAASLESFRGSMATVSGASHQVTGLAGELQEAASRVAELASEAAAATEAIVRASAASAKSARGISEESGEADRFMNQVRSLSVATREASGVVRERVARSVGVVSFMQGSVNHFRSMGDVASHISEALHAAQSSLEIGPEGFDIQLMKEVHLTLLGRLERATHGGLALKEEEVPEARACPLGLWLDGEGRAALADEENFSRLGEVHDQIHATAREALTHLSAGNREGAAHALRFFHELQKNLFDLMDGLYMVREGRADRLRQPLVIPPELLLGVEALDRDHARLADVINRLSEAAAGSATNRELGALLKEVLEEARGHFEREEAWLVRLDPREQALHRREHQALLTRIEDFTQLFFAENLPFSRDLPLFMKNWLLLHLKGSDVRIRESLARTKR